MQVTASFRRKQRHQRQPFKPVGPVASDMGGEPEGGTTSAFESPPSASASTRPMRSRRRRQVWRRGLSNQQSEEVWNVRPAPPETPDWIHDVKLTDGGFTDTELGNLPGTCRRRSPCAVLLAGSPSSSGLMRSRFGTTCEGSPSVQHQA